jgi:hypothetical protein
MEEETLTSSSKEIISEDEDLREIAISEEIGDEKDLE